MLLANGIQTGILLYCSYERQDKTRQDRERNKIPRTIYSHILECKGKSIETINHNHNCKSFKQTCPKMETVLTHWEYTNFFSSPATNKCQLRDHLCMHYNY